MKQSAYPIIVELEVEIDGKWRNVVTQKCPTCECVARKIEYMKTMYGLENKNYRIYFILNSKINNIKSKYEQSQ